MPQYSKRNDDKHCLTQTAILKAHPRNLRIEITDVTIRNLLTSQTAAANGNSLRSEVQYRSPHPARINRDRRSYRDILATRYSAPPLAVHALALDIADS